MPGDTDTPAPSGRAKPPKRPDPRLRRSAARLAAVQALYQMEMTGASRAVVEREFEDHRLDRSAAPDGGEGEPETAPTEADLALFRAILAGVVADQARIDQLTDRALVERWPLGRIDATLRALFRAAGFELTGRPDIPPKVAISEYVDIAKAFYDEGKEARFVNGVLDHMAREARPGDFA